MASKNLILDPDDAKCLEDKNLVTYDGTTPDGRNRRRIDRSWMFSEDSVQSAVSGDSGYSDKFLIPTELDSIETLQYLGFTATMAKVIWDRWAANCDDADFPYDFIQLAVGKIQSSTADAHVDITNWAPIFQELGLSEELHNAIVKPQFKNVRDTESAKFWIQDTLEIRYYQLKAIQRASHNRSRKSRSGGSQFNPLSSGPSAPSGASGSQTGQQRHSRELSGGSPTVDVATADAAQEKPSGFTILWKGIARERIGWDASGKILAGSLRSQPPTDFSGRSNDVLYFSKEREVAEDYARYAKARLFDDDHSVALLRLSVPSTLLIDTFGQHFVTGDEWKKLIYLCRRGKDLDEEDINIDYLTNKPLLIGPIAKGNNAKYQDLTTWSDLSNDNKMEIPPKGSRNFAVQFVFLGAATIRTLAGEAKIEVDQWFRGS